MSEFESMVIKTLSAYSEQLNAIQTLLTALVGDCEAAEILKKRRAANAERMRRVRAQTVGEKTNEEKEDIPPTPPIGEKEDKRKDSRDSRAREESVDSSGQTYLPGIISEEEAKQIEEERRAAEKAAEREIFEEHFENYFTEWWKLYPKKQRKTRSREKLYKILEAKFKKGGNLAVDALMSIIFKSTHRWIESDLWNRENKAYICHPMTWLNQERYLDEDIPKYTPRASRFERKTENQNCIVDYSDRPI